VSGFSLRNRHHRSSWNADKCAWCSEPWPCPDSNPHALGQDNYCAACGFSYPCEGAWRADAERLAALLRMTWRHVDAGGGDCDVCAALVAHDALTGDKK